MKTAPKGKGISYNLDFYKALSISPYDYKKPQKRKVRTLTARELADVLILGVCIQLGYKSGR